MSISKIAERMLYLEKIYGNLKVFIGILEIRGDKELSKTLKKEILGE